MRKNEKGILTIEASIVLCVLTLFMLFLFNFATVYRAQNMVSHATLQTADAVALESYLREASFETDEENLLFWANRINGVTNISQDSFESLRSADLPTIAKEKFTLAVGSSAAAANTTLKQLCVKDGLSGIDLSESYVDLTKNDVIIHANYTIKLRFPVFGASELKVTKTAKAKTAGEIRFGLNVIPEETYMGTTKGSGKYNMGTEVQISAKENYGFDFTGWHDGNTENPRTVTVTGAQTYIAKFKRHNFGVNLFISDPTAEGGKVRGSNAFGTVTASGTVGGGEYSYESTVAIKAETNPGYQFQLWQGSKISESGVESIQRSEPEFEAKMDGTYDLTAVYKPITYQVSVTTQCEAAKTVIGVREKGMESYTQAISVDYGKQLQLRATELTGYTFLGWYKDGKKISDQLTPEMPVPIGGGTYEAKYDKDPILTLRVNGSGSAKVVSTGQSNICCKRGTTVQVQAVAADRNYFLSWSDGQAATHWVTVNSDMTLTANFRPLYTVTVITNGHGTASGGGNNFREGDTAALSASAHGGYRFARWEKSIDGGVNYGTVSYDQNYRTTVTCNVIYRAIFETLNCTVTLDPNGGAMSSARSYTVSYGGSSQALPKPVRQGYRFKGWSLGGSNYGAGSAVSSIRSNITLVAQWSTCNGHVWGRCGVDHKATTPKVLSHHSNSHKTSVFQCSLCVECGAFDGGTCGCGSFTKNQNKSTLSAVHLCFTGSGCRNLWSVKRVYNIHDQIGYP